MPCLSSLRVHVIRRVTNKILSTCELSTHTPVCQYTHCIVEELILFRPIRTIGLLMHAIDAHTDYPSVYLHFFFLSILVQPFLFHIFTVCCKKKKKEFINLAVESC